MLTAYQELAYYHLSSEVLVLLQESPAHYAHAVARSQGPFASVLQHTLLGVSAGMALLGRGPTLDQNFSLQMGLLIRYGRGLSDFHQPAAVSQI